MPAKGAKGLVIAAVTLHTIKPLFNRLLSKHLIQISIESYFLATFLL